MDIQEKRKILNRIFAQNFSVRVNKKIFKIRPLTLDEKIYLDEYREDILESNRFEQWLSLSQCHGTLMRNGLLPLDFNKRIKDSEKKIEDLKVDLYKGHLNPALTKKNKEMLKGVRIAHNKLINTKHSLDYLTLEGYADILVKQEETRISCDLKRPTSFLLLQKLIEKIGTFINSAELRELARTEPWRPIWLAGKPNPFGKPSIYLSELQVSLLSLSRLYDSAFEHPECPDDSVLDDDDMFDGWLLSQKRERDKDKHTKNTDKLLGTKYSHHDEIYLPAQSKEDAQKIHELNTFEGKLNKKKREVLLKNKKKLEERELPDVIEKRKMRAVQAQAEKHRRK